MSHPPPNQQVMSKGEEAVGGVARMVWPDENALKAPEELLELESVEVGTHARSLHPGKSSAPQQAEYVIYFSLICGEHTGPQRLADIVEENHDICPDLRQRLRIAGMRVTT